MVERSTFFRARALIARLLEHAALARARYNWRFFARARGMARLLEMLLVDVKFSTLFFCSGS